MTATRASCATQARCPAGEAGACGVDRGSNRNLFRFDDSTLAAAFRNHGWPDGRRWPVRQVAFAGMSSPGGAGDTEDLPVAVEAWITEHLRDSHDRGFDRAADLYLVRAEPGEWQGTVVSWNPATGEVNCRLPGCPTPVWYPLGADPAAGERVTRLVKATDPAYQAFVQGAQTEQERGEMIDLVDSGDAARAVKAWAARRDLLRRPHTSAAAAARAGRIQQFLLEAYERLGNLHDALWSLVELHGSDPAQYREVTGADRVLAMETFRRTYWQAIPPQQRKAAQARVAKRRSPR